MTIMTMTIMTMTIMTMTIMTMINDNDNENKTPVHSACIAPEHERANMKHEADGMGLDTIDEVRRCCNAAPAGAP